MGSSTLDNFLERMVLLPGNLPSAQHAAPSLLRPARILIKRGGLKSNEKAPGLFLQNDESWGFNNSNLIKEPSDG